MATPKEKRERRHRKTARDFRRWLSRNERASLERKTEAFNAIADSNFRESRLPQAERIAKKAVKQI